MGKHATHAAHANSVAAFHDLDLNKREALVLSAYLLANAPLTDREAATRLGFADMNAVRPRCSALIERGLLWECGSAQCTVTGRRVRVCMPKSLAKPREPVQQSLDEVLW